MIVNAIRCHCRLINVNRLIVCVCVCERKRLIVFSIQRTGKHDRMEMFDKNGIEIKMSNNKHDINLKVSSIETVMSSAGDD